MLFEDRFKLELHRKVVEHLRVDEQPVRDTGLRNIRRMRERMHPRSYGIRWVDLWQQHLEGPLDGLVDMCLRTDELGNDMRQMSPFVGVLSEPERMEALRLSEDALV